MLVPDSSKQESYNYNIVEVIKIRYVLNEVSFHM